MDNTKTQPTSLLYNWISPGRLFFLAVVLGIITGIFPHPYAVTAAENLGIVFVSLLKLISVPIIFLAIVATITGLRDKTTIRFLGGKTLKYTLLTTLVAATVALGLFLLLEPITLQNYSHVTGDTPYASVSYWQFVLNSVPSNIITPFSEGNVIAILLLASLTSFAILSLPIGQKTFLNNWFSGMFAMMLAITRLILRFLPVAIWAFISQFVIEIQADNTELGDLGLYLVCVVGANLVQAFVVLPLLLKFKGIPPLAIIRAALPALNLAFWSKSSSATLPATLNIAQQRLNIHPTVAGFTLPLCTAINMNACAGFIIITVLFVSMNAGIAFSTLEMFAWIGIATLAAIGNAGVPMGCYFLTIALLTTMNVPINLMFVILPAYLLLDMLETAINVWSDLCVATVVNSEVQGTELIAEKTAHG